MAENIDQLQHAFFEKEWARLKLSDEPGKSGWRTLVPAPDFVGFVTYLESNGIKGKALGLGCGGGRHAMLLAERGFDVYGIDFATPAIAMARANAEHAGLQIDFKRGDALDLPYNESFFDVVNDDGCLHHIDPAKWPLYVLNVARVLKSGGTLRIKAFSMNCAYYQQNVPKNSSTQWIFLKNSGHTYFFSEPNINSLFSKQFEIVQMEEKVHTQTADKKFFFVILKKQS